VAMGLVVLCERLIDFSPKKTTRVDPRPPRSTVPNCTQSDAFGKHSVAFMGQRQRFIGLW
jgi:hypothetical protein